MAIAPVARWGFGSAAGKAAAFLLWLGHAGWACAGDAEVLPWAQQNAASTSPVSTTRGALQANGTSKIVITVGVPQKIMPDKLMTDTHGLGLSPVSYADVPHWGEDDHLSAFKAFLASCPAVIERALQPKNAKSAPRALAEMCRFAQAEAASGRKLTKAAARLFFETHFKPMRVDQKIAAGLLTGYYEPLLKASRAPTADYKTPIYRRPPDLVNVVAESERGAKSASFTHMRQTAEGLRPYLTRAEIEKGGLSGRGLELLYFRDAVDVYFLQVQGSGRIELPDGETIRISYDGKNGFPYTSIGRELIEAGTFTPDSMSLKALSNWLKADRKRAEPVMWKNQSYVFFRELRGDEAAGAIGALGTPLHTGRSLAVDTAYHALGLPVYVCAPALTHATRSAAGFHRLMIAHDVGSAIKGPERGDIFFGSGDSAGRIAGVTKHAGHFYILQPVALMEAQQSPLRGEPAP